MLLVAVPLAIIPLAVDILEGAPTFFRVLDELADVLVAVREGEGPRAVPARADGVWRDTCADRVLRGPGCIDGVPVG